ncbi:MAG: IclR family transcriptional regulator, acetate operon repressor [Solirubrobacteraceae bacterium]|jgi:DNA-binding IclR family transcriptional regulator|nr:IclR family transcriptional regulator, acetate operon repressor [Solirubrobacteraceae bacterium]
MFVPSVEGANAESIADRLARILALVLERSPRTLTELAELAQVSAIEVAALVAALERHGLVAWDGAHAGLRPGPAELRFARSGVGREDLIDLAQPSMRRLASESGETVNLILPTPRGTEAVTQIDGSHLLGATNWVGRELPLHCTAAGKVFLAFGVSELPRGVLERRTASTLVDPELLERDLEAVRALGYATLVDELEDGLSAVAAPVRERGGGLIGVLSVSGASLRMAPHRLALLGRVAVEQAHALSTRLGHESALEDVLG